ncbi:MAG: SLAC1 anion channel family protein [Guyparkeria sp.]|uniref:SLAC1 anion channel family protein n=1 Tax=Guyparkeria sp. TaxID=2035736 RepID=UPI00397A0740
MSDPSTASNRLPHMPISMFAIVMGLAGLTLVLQHAERAWGLPSGIALTSVVIDIAVFAAIAVAYLSKWVRYPAEVRGEFNHPIRLSFFPAISIGLILLATATFRMWPSLALAFWVSGVVLHLLLTLTILSRWMHQTHFEIHHSNPAWFIPVVGNILVPLAGVPLGFETISWFFFSVGLVFWPVLLTILMYRYFFHAPMPGKLMPTLFILIAPPAVAFIAWGSLHPGEGLDDFGRVLFSFALFITLLLVWQMRHFIRLPFALSWWAYSFPVAAMTVATIQVAGHTGSAFWNALGLILTVILSMLIALLLVMTLRAAGRREICQPE